MLPLLLVGAVIAVPFAVWIGVGPGREALGIIRQWPALLLPAVSLWLGAVFLDEVSSDEMGNALFRWRATGISFCPSAVILMKMALHAAASALLLWMLCGRGDPSRRPPFARLLLGCSALLLGVWTLLFAALVPVFATVRPVATGALAYLIPFSALAVFLPLNLIVAPMTALLPECRGNPAAALAASLRLLSDGRWRRWLPTVGLHLVLIGGLTLIWLHGYLKIIKDENVVTTVHLGIQVNYDREWQTYSDFDLTATTRCVLNLTLDNGWVEEFCEAIEEEVPSHVAYATGLLTALLSTVFITAYALAAEGRGRGTAPEAGLPLPPPAA